LLQKTLPLILILILSSCSTLQGDREITINGTVCADIHDSHECFKEAERFFFGFGQEEDKEFSISLYQQAAAMGSTFAKARLGSFYFHGLVVDKDWVTSVRYLEDALTHSGDLKATRWKAVILSVLGLMYQKGPEGIQNETKSFQYLLQAAKLRYGPAQIKVAAAYLKGVGNKMDILEGYAWAKSAYHGGYTMIEQPIVEIEAHLKGERRELAWELAKRKIEKYSAIPMEDIWKQPLTEI